MLCGVLRGGMAQTLYFLELPPSPPGAHSRVSLLPLPQPRGPGGLRGGGGRGGL